eukprot:533992-Amphidinium_carterae.3
MKETPYTTGVKVMLVGGHSNDLCVKKKSVEQVKTPLVPTNKVSSYLKLRHVIENGMPYWVIPATASHPEVVLMTLQGKRDLKHYSRIQFECICRAMLDYLKGQRHFDMKYWQHLMAAEANRKWIWVYHLQAAAQSLGRLKSKPRAQT